MKPAQRVIICAGLAVALAAGVAPAPAAAGLFSNHQSAAKKKAELSDQDVANIQRAIDEVRYVDAQRMLDQAALAGLRDPRLTLLAAELDLAKGNAADALTGFREVETIGQTRAGATEGAGIALAMLGRRDEALKELQDAVSLDPGAWRAWNALGAVYDDRRDFAQAESAYSHALVGSTSPQIVLNNRGYSRLLQNRLDDAEADFVDALTKHPDFAAARTNLRLAMAMKGEYDRALAGESKDDKAALLNNAGYAAMMRGDYPRAEALFNEAMSAKGEFYGRAAANLDMAHDLSTRQKPGTPPDSAAH